MDPVTLENPPDIFVDFAGSPTGHISAESVSEEPTVYAYVPLRNWPHLKLWEAMQDQGQVEVSVRLKNRAVLMIVTALSTHSITLKAAEKFRRPIGLAEGEFVVPDDFDDPLPDELQRLFEGR